MHVSQAFPLNFDSLLLKARQEKAWTSSSHDSCPQYFQALVTNKDNEGMYTVFTAQIFTAESTYLTLLLK